MPAIYQADTWCDSCADDIRQRIATEGKAPENPDDETTFDSDEYPKRMDEDEEADSPQHCGSGEDCLEAETLPSGTKIGKLLSRELTPDGVVYVKFGIEQGGEVAEWWCEQFEAAGYDFKLDEAEAKRKPFCSIGDCIVHRGFPANGNPYGCRAPADPRHPNAQPYYRSSGLSGDERRAALYAFRDGEDTSEFTYWYAPCGGGSCQITDPGLILWV